MTVLPKKNGQGFRFQPDKGSVWIVFKSKAKSQLLSLPEIQGKVLFGPSENPNPHSSRTGKDLLVVKQKRTLFPLI